LIDYQQSVNDLSLAIKIGLPQPQKKLALNLIKSYKIVIKSSQVEGLLPFFEYSGNVYKNIQVIYDSCPKVKNEKIKIGKYYKRHSYSYYCENLITINGYDFSKTSAAVLEFFPYQNINDLNEVSKVFIKTEKILEENGEHTLVPHLINTQISMFANFIHSCNIKNNITEAEDAIFSLRQWLLDSNSPVDAILLSGNRVTHSRINYFLGEKEGMEAYNIIASTNSYIIKFILDFEENQFMDDLMDYMLVEIKNQKNPYRFTISHDRWIKKLEKYKEPYSKEDNYTFAELIVLIGVCHINSGIDKLNSFVSDKSIHSIKKDIVIGIIMVRYGSNLINDTEIFNSSKMILLNNSVIGSTFIDKDSYKESWFNLKKAAKTLKLPDPGNFDAYSIYSR